LSIEHGAGVVSLHLNGLSSILGSVNMVAGMYTAGSSLAHSPTSTAYATG